MEFCILMRLYCNQSEETMKYSLVFFMLIGLLLSCHSPNNEKDNHAAAIPDGTALRGGELSESDQKKLSEAKGIEAKSVSLEILEEKLKEKPTSATVCYFWTLENESNANAFRELSKLIENMEAGNLSLVLVNMDEPQKNNEVNAMIRSSGIAADFYILGNKKITSILDYEFPKNIPAYFMYSTSDGTGIWFDRTLTYEELYVLVQPFVI